MTVSSAADSGANSLRERIGAATGGDTLVFDSSLDGATIALLSEIDIDKSLTIIGLGAERLSISGQQQTRLFNVIGGTSTISHLTLRDGLARGSDGGDSEFGGGGGGGTARGGAIVVAGGGLTIEAVILRDNEARGGDGGASGVPGAGMIGGGAGIANPSFITGNGGSGGNGNPTDLATAAAGSQGTFGGGGGGGGGGGINAAGTAYNFGAGGASSIEDVDADFSSVLFLGRGRAGSAGLIEVEDMMGNDVDQFEPTIPPGTGGGGAGGAGLGGAIYVVTNLLVIDSHFAANRALGGKPGARGDGVGLGRAGAIFAQTGSTVQAAGMSFGAGSLEGNYQTMSSAFPSTPAYEFFVYGTKMLRNPDVYGTITAVGGSATLSGPPTPAHLGDPRLDFVLWDYAGLTEPSGFSGSELLSRLGRRGVRSQMAAPVGFAVIDAESSSGVWLIDDELIATQPTVLVDPIDLSPGGDPEPFINEDSLVFTAIGVNASAQNYALQIIDSGGGNSLALEGSALTYRVDIGSGFTAAQAVALLQADKVLSGMFLVQLGPDRSRDDEGNSGDGELAELTVTNFNDALVSSDSALLIAGASELEFVPYNDFLSTAGEFDQQPTLTLRGWDGTGGAAGDRVDTSAAGLGQPFTSALNHARIDVVDSLSQLAVASGASQVRLSQDTIFDKAGVTVASAGFPMAGNRQLGLYTIVGVGGIWASGSEVSSLHAVIQPRPIEMWRYNRSRDDRIAAATGVMQFASIEGGSDLTSGVNPANFNQRITSTHLVLGNFTQVDVDSGPMPLVRDFTARAAGVTHYKVLAVDDGTLFADAAFTVPVSVGGFRSYGNGNARLYMRPTAGFVGRARFQIQNATSAMDAALIGDPMADPIFHYLIVDDVADELSVDAVSVNEDSISPPIEIRRNVGRDVGLNFVRITNVVNGQLFYDRRAQQPISAGDAVGLYTLRDGVAGVDLYFMPAAGVSGVGSFDIQGQRERGTSASVGAPVSASITIEPEVDITSVSVAPGLYGPNNLTLLTSVVFEQPVTVSIAGGLPTIELQIAGAQRLASYVSGSGSSTLVFSYTLTGAEPDDSDGVEVNADCVVVPAGSSILALGQPIEEPDLSFAQSLNPTATVDFTPPAMPTTPDLLASSDTGASSVDDLTADTTPTFSGTAEADSIVTLLEGANVLGSATATGGNWNITSFMLSAGSYEISAQAADGAGNESPDSGMLTVVINQPPSLTAPATVQLDEDDSIVFAAGDAIVAADADGSQPMTATAMVSNGTLRAMSGSGATLVGDDSANLMVSGTVAQVATALNGLMLTPTPDYFGPDALQLSLTDGVEAANATVTVDVVPVNDPPSFSLSPDISLPVNTSGAQSQANFAFDISAGPSNESSQILNFGVTELSDPNGIVSGLAMSPTGTLSYTASGNGGVAVVEVQLSDSGGGLDTAAPQSFQITVGTAADIAVNKTDGLPFVFNGMETTYMITVTNLGPADAPMVTVFDDIPEQLSNPTWTCTPIGGASCSPAGNGNIDEVVNLPASSSVVYMLDAKVDGLAPGANLSNTVTVSVSVNQFDTVAANNVDTDVSVNGALFFNGFEEPGSQFRELLEALGIDLVP